MTIKDKACDYVTKINNVEFTGEGEPVYSFEQLQDAFLAGAAGKQELYEALKVLYAYVVMEEAPKGKMLDNARAALANADKNK